MNELFISYTRLFEVSSDTTLVGDQVTLNVNVFLRSLVQAIGVLIFMFMVSWQLSILAFISVPAITVLSKFYGQFIRSLTKVMQTKVRALVWSVMYGYSSSQTGILLHLAVLSLISLPRGIAFRKRPSARCQRYEPLMQPPQNFTNLRSP